MWPDPRQTPNLVTFTEEIHLENATFCAVLSTLLNPSLVNIHISNPLKTTENIWFSGVFRRYKMETLLRNWFKAFENITVKVKFWLNRLALRSHKIFQLQRHKVKNTNNNTVLSVSVYFRLNTENTNIDQEMIMEPIVLILWKISMNIQL